MVLGDMAVVYVAVAATLLYFAVMTALTLRLNGLKRAGARLAPSTKEMLGKGGLQGVGYLFSSNYRMLYDGVVTALVHLSRVLLFGLLIGWPFVAATLLTGAD